MDREDFPMLNSGYIYLDNGATTWKPKKVIDKISYFINYFIHFIEVISHSCIGCKSRYYISR